MCSFFKLENFYIGPQEVCISVFTGVFIHMLLCESESSFLVWGEKRVVGEERVEGGTPNTKRDALAGDQA